MAVPDLKVDPFGWISTLIFIVLTLLVRVFRLRDEFERPTLLFKGGKFCRDVLTKCTILKDVYKPPWLWGRSGHIQTILHAALGRFGVREHLRSKLCTLEASDGATVSYNIFCPNLTFDRKIKKQENRVVLIVPGIANHCKTVYVEAFTYLLLEQGFDVAVYNHLGAFPKAKLTSQRLFTYGCTSDLDLVVADVLHKFEGRKIIGVGFSMGANVLLKYLGEKPSRQEDFVCAISVCQGYDIVKASPLLLDWTNLRRFYNWAISRNMKRLLLGPHKTKLMQFERQKSSIKLDWRKITSSSSLQELDEAAVRRFAKFKNVHEFYKWSSSSTYMQKIAVPVLLINAVDDPIIPEELFAAPKKLVESNENAVFVIMKHGGHLGFFEGGNLFPRKVTWLDRALIQFILAFEDVYETYNHNAY